MKRRDLIKAGVLAGAMGLISGCSKSASETVSISPKQTDTYKFSAPMPFDYGLIDEIDELNKKLKKSKVVTLYNNLPPSLSVDYLGDFFHNSRNILQNDKIKTIDDFCNCVKYAQDKGFHFVYTMNSPKPFSGKEFKKYEKPLFTLLNKLQDAGVKEIKVANTQLMDILEKNTDFNLSASTSFEYHNVSQYKNLIETYKRIKTINIAMDDNRNFLFLKELKKAFPKTDIEIMVNERGCIHGCPARISHPCSYLCRWQCTELEEKIGAIKFFFKTNVIYPWDLEYYSAIGINNFKLVCCGEEKSYIRSLEHTDYLVCIENGIENISANDFFNKLFGKNMYLAKMPDSLKLSDIMPFLPDIRHFVKHGDKCANICDIDCTYCLDCAEKIEALQKIS